KKLRLGASLVAFLVALLPAATPVAAASCNGASHESSLQAGTVTPSTVTTGEAVTFSVTYTDTAACAPSKVVVSISGVGTFPLAGSGTDYASGVTYSASLNLPVGTRAYSFTVTSGNGRGTTTVTLTGVSPTNVVVAPPAPTATPVPAPVATPVAAVPPPPPPPPVAAPAAVAPAPGAPTAPPPPPPTTPPSAAPVAPSVVQPPAAASPSPAPTKSAALLAPMHDSWVGGPVAAAPASSTAPQPRDPEPLGTFLAEQLPLTAGTFVATTAGGLTLFFLLIRRRRPTDPEPQPAAVTESAASATLARLDQDIPPATSSDAPIKLNLPPIRELVPPLDPYLLEDPDERVGPSPDEAGIPRWLRPSVRYARTGPIELRQRNWKA
ncbi:MAG TPA: hypothetical protein VFV59_01635, partial [Candidatus Limnocylindria bacterium]|nr:hypothetical protein [Candidatus Limnocylindria bacterium]